MNTYICTYIDFYNFLASMGLQKHYSLSPYEFVVQRPVFLYHNSLQLGGYRTQTLTAKKYWVGNKML